MSDPRIIPPDEARQHGGAGYQFVRDLAYTSAVLGNQREAVLALHRPMGEGATEPWCWECDGQIYPCRTARALGVTE